jgi:hypothetical protein
MNPSPEAYAWLIVGLIGYAGWAPLAVLFCDRYRKRLRRKEAEPAPNGGEQE